MKWEYDLIEFDAFEEFKSDLLNKMGQQGWRLVCVDNGIAYFERPVKETTVSNVFRDGVPVKQANDD